MNTDFALREQKILNWGLAVVCALFLWAALSGSALAAPTGDEFNDLYDLVKQWSTGSLGKTIAVTFLLVGLGVGIIRGSIMAAVGSIAAGVSLVMLPTIIEGLFGAAG